MSLRVSRPAHLCGMLVLASLAATSIAADEAEKAFSETPEVAPSRVRGEAGGAVAGVASGREGLARGPAPTWIWGRSDDRKYGLVAEFAGGARSAWIKASADNSVTLTINGQVVGSTESWQEPIEVDVTGGSSRPGPNELVRAEVANDGGRVRLRAASSRVVDATTAMSGEVRRLGRDSWHAARRAEGRQARSRPVTAHWARWASAPGATSSRPQPNVVEDASGTSSRCRQGVPGREALHRAQRDTLGSWVAIGFDDKGRLIASDQDDKGL